MKMAFDPECPSIVKEIIRNHPALLGESFKEVGPSEEHSPFVTVTESIIKAHGFSHTYEWEYQCDNKTRRAEILRLWIGKKGRTKKNLRTIALTAEEADKVQPFLGVM